MDIFKSFATDESKELEGAWVQQDENSEVLIARLGNRRYGRLLAKKIEEHQAELNKKDEAADKLSDQIMADVLAETILLDWRGEMNYNGATLPYSKDNAVKVLLHHDYRKWIVEQASKFEHFRAKQEIAQGNA